MKQKGATSESAIDSMRYPMDYDPTNIRQLDGDDPTDDDFKVRKFRTDKHIRRRNKKNRGEKASRSQMIKRNLAIVSSSLFMAGAIGMIVVGAIRFSEMEAQSVHDVILNFYFLFLGFVLALN